MEQEQEHQQQKSGGGGGCGGGGGDTTGGATGTTPGTSSAIIATTSSGGGGSNSRDVYLKHLNKISHKISKPIRRTASFDRSQIESLTEEQMKNQAPAPPPQQNQPPVYNINKSDFRDVVQRLTGSPAHERFSTPPPIQPPKPQSSRLQRIRPPPLAQISNRPPPQLPQMSQPAGFFPGQRQPLSPLPPFPSVHAAAESPISAYMRFFQTPAPFGASPRWSGLPPPPQPMPNFPLMPTSPQPFGCIPSPRSPYAAMPPSMMFPPSQLGFHQQLPLSPTPPVPSPSWKGT